MRPTGPARIRSEARAVTLRKLRQTGANRLMAPSVRVVERSAPERREPGAEDDCRIDEIRIPGDALAQCGHRLVHEHQNQTVAKVGRWNSRQLAFDRLALDPAIETFAGLLAELFGAHE